MGSFLSVKVRQISTMLVFYHCRFRVSSVQISRLAACAILNFWSSLIFTSYYQLTKVRSSNPLHKLIPEKHAETVVPFHPFPLLPSILLRSSLSHSETIHVGQPACINDGQTESGHLMVSCSLPGPLSNCSHKKKKNAEIPDEESAVRLYPQIPEFQ